jgi:hypothetical protein
LTTDDTDRTDKKEIKRPIGLSVLIREIRGCFLLYGYASRRLKGHACASAHKKGGAPANTERPATRG